MANAENMALLVSQLCPSLPPPRQLAIFHYHYHHHHHLGRHEPNWRGAAAATAESTAAKSNIIAASGMLGGAKPALTITHSRNFPYRYGTLLCNLTHAHPYNLSTMLGRLEQPGSGSLSGPSSPFLQRPSSWRPYCTLLAPEIKTCYPSHKCLRAYLTSTQRLTGHPPIPSHDRTVKSLGSSTSVPLILQFIHSASNHVGTRPGLKFLTMHMLLDDIVRLHSIDHICKNYCIVTLCFRYRPPRQQARHSSPEPKARPGPR
jgi:hypothetical protein